MITFKLKNVHKYLGKKVRKNSPDKNTVKNTRRQPV